MLKVWEHFKYSDGTEFYCIDGSIPRVCDITLSVVKKENNGSVTWDWKIKSNNGNMFILEHFEDKKCGYVYLEDAKEWCLRSYNDKLESFKGSISNLETIRGCDEPERIM